MLKSWLLVPSPQLIDPCKTELMARAASHSVRPDVYDGRAKQSYSRRRRQEKKSND
jgi:toxin ParE1/3/4